MILEYLRSVFLTLSSTFFSTLSVTCNILFGADELDEANKAKEKISDSFFSPQNKFFRKRNHK